MPLDPGARLGRYEIQALLGAGSMGEVYRAKDQRLGRDVAIKVLLAEFSCDPERLGRFEREARAASALNHPNIVSLFDVSEHGESPYLVSELLEGQTLRALLDVGALSVEATLQIALQVARGLEAAHEKGIVHRDLKPENVFLLGDGRVKVLDFGLAKLLDPGGGACGLDGAPDGVVTTAGVALGTVDYMSPEAMRGQEMDHRTDLFSFGALVYEMLSGVPPFRRESAVDTFSAILDEDPASLSKAGVRAPVELQKLVRRCLEKKVERRPESASEVVRELEALAAVPTTAGGGKPGYSRVALIALGIVTVGVIAVFVATRFL